MVEDLVEPIGADVVGPEVVAVAAVGAGPGGGAAEPDEVPVQPAAATQSTSTSASADDRRRTAGRRPLGSGTIRKSRDGIADRSPQRRVNVVAHLVDDQQLGPGDSRRRGLAS